MSQIGMQYVAHSVFVIITFLEFYGQELQEMIDIQHQHSLMNVVRLRLRFDALRDISTFPQISYNLIRDGS